MPDILEQQLKFSAPPGDVDSLELLAQLAAGTATTAGIDFFPVFIDRLAAIFKARAALVTEKISDAPVRVRTLGFWVNGSLVENIEYDVSTTPCSCVYQAGLTYFPKFIQEIFDQDPDLEQLGVHSYMGTPMIAPDGTVLGHICVLGDKPLGEDQHSKPVIEIFAARAATELARMQSDRKLQEYQAHLEDMVDLRTKELEVAKEVAENASLAKTKFLAHMSHELRTPMNAIFGYAQLLLADDDYPLALNHRDQVEEIFRASKHLISIINEILDLTAVESGKLKLERTDFLLSDICNECVGITNPLAEQHDIKVNFDDAGIEGVMVRTDAKKIKQVIINLLTNAIKYNKPEGKVEVFFNTEKPEGITISVRDTGPGIPEDSLTRIFETFERLPNTSVGTDGVGIGLALSKRIIKLLQGKIIVASEVGIGTTFSIELPRS